MTIFYSFKLEYLDLLTLNMKTFVFFLEQVLETNLEQVYIYMQGMKYNTNKLVHTMFAFIDIMNTLY
jgi:hypothetical protein